MTDCRHANEPPKGYDPNEEYKADVCPPIDSPDFLKRSINEFHRGSLGVVCGPMFSGKSEELIRRLKRVQISGKNFMLFKPSIDNRYDAKHVISHDQRKLEAIITGTNAGAIKEIEARVAKHDAEVITFDEGIFYDDYSAARPSGPWASC